MSASEFAFLAIGLLLGVASGAALIEVIRARPPAPREVRVTMAADSVPKRPATLAVSPFLGSADIGQSTDPGDQPWAEPRTSVAVPVAGAGDVLLTPATISQSPLGRTPVAIAIESEPDPMLQAIQADRQPTLVLAGVAATATGVGEPEPARSAGEARGAGLAAKGDAAGDANVGTGGADVGTGGADVGAGVAGRASQPQPETYTGPCADQQRLVVERCELAARAADHALEATDRLRAAKRAYDEHTARAEAAQDAADPRSIQRAKDEAQAVFHGARTAARTAEEAEAAASAWLQQINQINAAVREATLTLKREREAASALVLAIERLEAEADAARIGAETAREACLKAREDLARCQELAVAAALGPTGPPPPEPPAEPLPTGRILADVDLPEEAPLVLGAAAAGPTDAGAGLAASESAVAWVNPVIIRILRGDHEALARVAAQLAGGDQPAAGQWQLLLGQFVDAVAGRTIEESLLDVDAEHPFWSMFTLQQNREIVAALASLGYRFDGLGGFADARVPSQRDLSLAVGYAGLDPMRIRRWPNEAEMVELFTGTQVAADEYLMAVAPDLTLSELVTALGRRADELAELWNAWGQVRPLLLAPA